MVRCSNCFMTMLNFVTLVASIILIMLAMSISMNKDNAGECAKTLQKPLMIIGVAMLVLSLMGIIGAACHVSFLLWIYLFVLFLIIIAMIAYSIFNIVVTLNHIDDPAKNSTSSGEWEDKFQEYNGWLKDQVPKEKDWEKIRSCLTEAKYCRVVPKDRSVEFYKERLPTMESGCCKPPTYCNFEFVNATTWNPPKAGAPADQDIDCKTWSNEQSGMCYKCNSCKKAVFEHINNYYKHSALTTFIVFVLISIVYSIGCCALTNNSYRRRAYVYHGYRPYGPGPYGPGPYA